MAGILKGQKSFFYMFRYAGDNQSARVQMLRKLSPILVKAFIELGVNALYGVIPLSRTEKSFLKEIKPFILLLVSSKSSLKKKKVLLIKHHKESYQLVKTLFSKLQALVWYQE